MFIIRLRPEWQRVSLLLFEYRYSREKANIGPDLNDRCLIK
jgi:hypothetical protein